MALKFIEFLLFM